MKSEKDVKSAVKKILTDAGAWYFMPVQCGYGRHGIPDFIACYHGRFVAIETKFNGRKPTPRQAKELLLIGACGGLSMVIDETNVHDLERALDDMARC
jgi:hypothetical protein